jgi:SAM-dependent methyltransferase
MGDRVSIIQQAAASETLPEALANADYLRQRIEPDPRDQFYLPLADLRSFLDVCGMRPFATVLDYGCGGSPYRGLFRGVDRFIRADYVDSPNLDVRIDDSGLLPLPTDSCDCVLSTQVFEHVLSPQQYLSEAMRVLRPGGTLILTTNGIWEDHGCPYDFWRWTADGLRREVSQAGFDVVQVTKLTTGPRALLFLLGSMPFQISDSRRTMHGLGLWLLNRFLLRNRRTVHRWADRRYASHRVVDAGDQRHRLYICLGVMAIKRPEASSVAESVRTGAGRGRA